MLAPRRPATSAAVGFERRVKRDPVDHRHAVRRHRPLRQRLVHRERAGGGVAARVGAAGGVEQALHAPVLAEGPVERREDDVPRGVVALGKRVRHHREEPRRERPRERERAGRARSRRDLLLGGGPSGKDGDHGQRHSTSLQSLP